MKIVIEKPPKHIWDEAHTRFDIDDDWTVYTYGDGLYNPAGVPIDAALMAHESMHSEQQQAYAGSADAWWRRYFDDKVFRFEQEAEAYAAQYIAYCLIVRDGNYRTRYMVRLAADLSSPLYRIGITHSRALSEIKNHLETI